MKEDFDETVQCYTMCEECGSMDWCVTQNGIETCRGCFFYEDEEKERNES